jgi:hypothetical protein
MSMKYALKSLIPNSLLVKMGKVRNIFRDMSYQNMTTLEVFRKIYADNEWGLPSNSGQKFYSGSGSHDSAIVDPYIKAVKEFLESFDTKLQAVDLGCGDFNVGAQLRYYCDNYIACDIVPELIEHNKKLYTNFDVDFRTLDLTNEELPDGDVVFIR